MLTEDQTILVEISAVTGWDGAFSIRTTAPTAGTGRSTGETIDEIVELWRPRSDNGLRDQPAFDFSGLHTAEGLLRITHTFASPILLELGVATLRSAPWETILTTPPFSGRSEGVIRYSRQLSKYALSPLPMPVDVLVADLGYNPEPEFASLPHALKHFRVTHATRVTSSRLRELLRSHFDIVHLRSVEAADSDPLTDLLEALPHDELGSLLMEKGSATRLVLLEDNSSNLRRGLQVGHAAMGGSGPAVIVTSPWEFDVNKFYYELTHSTELHVAFLRSRRGQTPSLMLPRSGESALDLKNAARALLLRVEAEQRRTTEAIADLQNFPSGTPWTRNVEDRLRRSSDTIHSLELTALDFLHESGGIDPMSDASARLGRISDNRDLRLVAQRVVNTWLTSRNGDVFPRGRALRPGETCMLQVMIGPISALSVIPRPAAVPDGELTQFFRAGAVPLQVIVSSLDFRIADDVGTLLLPQPPAASEPLAFELTAPAVGGTSRIRVGVYHRNNLLQSLLLTTVISDRDEPIDGAVTGEVEWALSGSLKDLDKYTEQTVSIMANETLTGSHVLLVKGTTFHHTYEIGELESNGAVEQARGNLQWICGDPSKGEPYNFENDNRGSMGSFVGQVATLANYGLNLYLALLGKERQLDALLRQALAVPARIQGANMKSAKRVFPWALVYDHRLVFSPSNKLCPDFLDSLELLPAGGNLAGGRCFSEGCQFREDVNVVCPSGFWGFRHVIEQPLGTLPASKDVEDAVIGTRELDAVDKIPAASLSVLIGYSPQLTKSRSHVAHIRSLLPAAPPPQTESEVLRVGQGLRRGDLTVVYFYCHGGSKYGEPWFQFDNSGELFRPNNLYSLGVQWPQTHPLIVVNGCETVGLSPDDLTSFNKEFAESMAGGVIGTEISIPETLGDYVGSEFMAGFLEGREVGQVIREVRLGLLARLNLLGLAYTPYCLAKLHLAP
ncbi:hypothetical protein SRABI26_04533 [Arthrobacter sp. Bi26]|uniref:hypothetical protein n=1 Tax=Arthrobacter sp. Bi26 TaxID=2822350 RepID=UPI001E027726|nr:hypothetical protein [Arthrobacter sp. Bi26]CAH0300798.1 hypothetical protein SRABI26_04533 [Arthrobacter sp. Bi26]